MSKDKNAIQITFQTLVGHWAEKFPYPSGNCFSVEFDDGTQARIVNFGVENLREAIKRGVNYPIKCRLIDEKHAIIHDERIPDNWYKDLWCECCCPKELLPLPQKLVHERQILQGARKENPSGSVMFDFSKRPIL